MSYDIQLNDPVTGAVLELKTPHQCMGGTYQIGGTTELWLNVTWNYAKYYYDAHEEGIRAIYGLSGAESVPVLEAMIHYIENKYPGKEVSDNYWDATPGNALRPLYQLLSFAKMRPDGVWEGD